MKRLFDAVIVADWSARNAPSPRRPSSDAIWIGVDGAEGPEAPVYLRTRAEAEAWLAARLAAEAAAGRRVLAGFDFPFGWPRGAAARLAGAASAPALWDWLAREVADGPDNASNRFAVAQAANDRFSGAGPFWGRPRSAPHPGVPERKGDWKAPAGPPPDWPPERRHADAAAAGAKSVWQLAYAGSVGSQALLGMPAIARIRRAEGLAGAAAVWPFETGWRPGAAPVVLAEVYPSLLARAVAARQRPGEATDSAQVRVLAAAFAGLDAAGALAPLFAAPPLAPAALADAEREEGWILGLGAGEAMTAALGA